jgi:translation initiation factor IF-3
MPLSKAQEIADNDGYDLVLMSPSAKPVVCKIMDYSKYKFDMIKKEKEIKKSQKTIEVKEIQLSMTITDHDISYRINNAVKFLGEGNKVKVALRMKGRQIAYKDACMAVVNNFIAKLSDYGTTEKAPEINGKTISVVVSPIKK